MSTPATQQCAFLVRPGCVELRTVPVPAPGPGQVLVRVERALVGGTDRKAFARGHPQIPMPGPFGHRYAGRVAALGEGAPAFAVGEPVMGVHRRPCLACPVCRRGRQNLCPNVMREKVLGALGQYLCVPAPVARHNLFPRPESLSAEQATFLEPVACVVHGLEMVEWRGVERVLVLGLGSMGLLFAATAAALHPGRAVGAGRRADRVALARRFGLAAVVDLSAAPPAEPGSGDGRFDVVIECTGKLDGWQEAFARAAPGGQVLLFGGLPRGTALSVDSYRLHYDEIRLLGAFHFSPRDVAMARDYLLEGVIDAEPLVSGCYPLARVGEALDRLVAGDGLQFAIDPWAGEEAPS